MDYKNSKIAFGANFGKNKLVVQHKNVEQQLEVKISDNSLVVPLEINEFAFVQDPKYGSKGLLKGAQIAASLIFAFAIGYALIVQPKSNSLFVGIPIVIFSVMYSVVFQKKVLPFELALKKF